MKQNTWIMGVVIAGTVALAGCSTKTKIVAYEPADARATVFDLGWEGELTRAPGRAVYTYSEAWIPFFNPDATATLKIEKPGYKTETVSMTGTEQECWEITLHPEDGETSK